MLGRQVLLRLSCEYAPESPHDPMWFYFRPKELSHLIDTGSRVGTISSIEKGVGEKPLELGVRGLGMIRLC